MPNSKQKQKQKLKIGGKKPRTKNEIDNKQNRLKIDPLVLSFIGHQFGFILYKTDRFDDGSWLAPKSKKLK